MESDPNDLSTALHCMIHAHSTILRELLRALVEEGVLAPHRAAQVVQAAVDMDFPKEQSTGDSYELARESLARLADAFAWYQPGGKRRDVPAKPRKDLS